MRYNVLVAEDEMPILRGICKSIEETNPNFYVSATALNGRAAIEAIQTQQIQLVFVDINMPVMSGLEVLKYIRQNHPEIITVVLSGYQDFHYAQQALKLGASDYLLKPLKRTELSVLLAQFEKRFQQQKDSYARQIFTPDSDTTDTALLGWGGRAWLAVVYIGSYQLQPSEILVTESTRMAEQWIREQLDRNYGRLDYCFVPSGRYAARGLLVAPSSCAPWALMRKLFADGPAGLMPVTIAAYPEMVKSEDFLQKYHGLRIMAHNRMLFEESSFLLYGENGSTKEENEVGGNPTEKETAVLLNEYRQVLLGMKKPCRSAVIRLTKNYVQKAMLHTHSGCSYFDLEEDILLALESTWDRKTLAQKIRALVLQGSTVSALAENGKAQIARELRLYLEENLDQYITLELLERKFGYVAAHLRELFREAYGCLPLEYLLTLRIERAKKMLEQDISIKEIASAVGFQDALYFSKVFKRSTGCSPSEYRGSKQ